MGVKVFEDDVANAKRDRQVGIVFANFDKSKLGFLNKYEFQTAMKCYNLDLTDHKALELLSIGDPTGSGLIDMEGFVRILMKVEDELTVYVLKRYKKNASRLGVIFVVGFSVLLFLLSFVYLGIAAFGKPDIFNSLINSVLPMAMGKVVSLTSNVGEDEEETEEEDGGTREEINREIISALGMLDISKFKSM